MADPAPPILSATAASTRSPLLRGSLEAAARLAALALLFGLFTLLVGPSFLSAGNIENICTQSAVYAMAGLGMTMILITGGIDLAAGSIIALSMVVTSLLLKSNVPVPLAALGGTLTGALAGAVQGSLISMLRIVPFIITLGGLVSIRGLTKEIAGNQEITPPANWLSQNLMFPVQGRTFNWQLVPLGVWATLLAAIFAAVLLRYTRFGRSIYAVGSSESTARLCGLPVQRTKIMVYALSGTFGGLAGVLEFSKLNLGQPTGAMMYELYIIAACVIGGTSLRGGVGTIFGTVIGALIIGTLNAGTQQAGWAKQKQEIVIGLIIIAAVALDQLRSRRQS